MKGKFVTLLGNMTVDGTVDLNTKTTNCDSTIKAVDQEAAVTLAFVADSTRSHGQLDESAYPAIVFHFDPAVTTVAEFETAVTNSQHLVLVTPGTGTNVLQVTVDEFAAFSLASGTINAANDQAQIDMTGMINSTIMLNQLTDSGTVTLLVEKTIDGTNWATVVSKADTDFPAGANKSIAISLSDTNGMPLVCKAVRVTSTAYGASGIYSLAAAGTLIEGYR
jgi:hypothetical protein